MNAVLFSPRGLRGMAVLVPGATQPTVIQYPKRFKPHQSKLQGRVVSAGQPLTPTKLGARSIFEWKRFISLSRYYTRDSRSWVAIIAGTYRIELCQLGEKVHFLCTKT